MKKALMICLFALAAFVLVGCSSSKAEEPEKEKDYTPVIEAALEGYEKENEDRDFTKDKEAYSYNRNESNIVIWENENNYYVFFRKNYADSVYGDLVHAFACKIGKSNDKWSSSSDDRSQIMDYLNDNEPPVYEEENVQLVKDDYYLD